MVKYYYNGIDSPIVDKQIMDALLDSHLRGVELFYQNKHAVGFERAFLKVSIDIDSPGSQSKDYGAANRWYTVNIQIFNKPTASPLEPYNAGPLVRHNSRWYPRFYASALEVKLHLARAKKQFKRATGIQDLYVKFGVTYWASWPFPSLQRSGSRLDPRNESESHSKQATVNIKKANAFRRLSAIKKIQKPFLKAYYSPSHPIAKRRLAREFEQLSKK